MPSESTYTVTLCGGLRFLSTEKHSPEIEAVKKALDALDTAPNFLEVRGHHEDPETGEVTEIIVSRGEPRPDAARDKLTQALTMLLVHAETKGGIYTDGGAAMIRKILSETGHVE